MHERDTVWDQNDPNFDLKRACEAIVDCMKSLKWLDGDCESLP